MTERYKLSLSGVWLLASLLSIILPVFLPSTYDGPNFFANSVGTATAAMFILSFPSSLFGLPLMFIVNYISGTEMRSIEAMYVNLLLLFVLGLVQWFWIVPRLFRTEPALQTLDIPDSHPERQLPEFREAADRPLFDAEERTPLERVLSDDDIR